MKEKLFSIFFCLYLFWNSALCSLLEIRGISMDGSIMRMTLVGIFTLSIVFFISFSPRIQGEREVFCLLLLFGVLLYSTRYFHRIDLEAFQLYNGQILRWGVDCIPGCLIGITLLKLKDYSFIHQILPWVCLLLTPFLAYSTLIHGRFEGQMVLESGMNYQIIAYQMAVMCCYSFYYSFIYKEKKHILVKLIMMPAMILQAVCCMMSGGRGGVVLLAVYALYMIFYLHERKNVSFGKIILVGSLIVCAFMYAANYFNLQESSGFARSSGLLNDDDRFEQWRQYLPYLSRYLLFGWGLGGDYFTVGFYSHNILIDWLLETGIVGSIIIARFFYLSYRRLYNLAAVNDIFFVVMVFFIYGFVMNLFSGYWISTSSNWMAWGIAMTYLYVYQHSNMSIE